MAGRFAIYTTAAAAIASISGWALGNYATTTAQPTAASFDIQNDVDLDTGTEPRSDTYSAQLAATDLAPDHIPVCRKGCGPSLYERETGTYFDDGSSQLDRIYAASDNYDSYAEATMIPATSTPPAPSFPDIPAPEVVPTTDDLPLPDQLGVR